MRGGGGGAHHPFQVSDWTNPVTFYDMLSESSGKLHHEQSMFSKLEGFWDPSTSFCREEFHGQNIYIYFTFFRHINSPLRKIWVPLPWSHGKATATTSEVLPIPSKIYDVLVFTNQYHNR